MSKELSSLEQIKIMRVGTEAMIKELEAIKMEATTYDEIWLREAIKHFRHSIGWLKEVECAKTLK